ncbi:PIKK family atypical protein kinase [Trichomonas vaginalis G3]|uniref:non-specific serine/threonine protein kinase n=1 Tax=Trichomonas vaginalis (strain ATCC PRA-98 / G3) TaxID=412133 RepID=A2D9E8_TRIV3|nr:ataxia telangiectasia mutated (ATM) -related family [Trichomonas vaginalis G3]EAY22804.1 PIKK family atypical protein kinase [Trichomonas vaginalis G3]KAI5526962.1 ataxia telangiectasia mutated (ATM) -related family [Trichomonas vaginalis G3]|eukprot:XP_001583790.1 PIKK family atypical protein kinase [Trichomonas vaginalis G3]
MAIPEITLTIPPDADPSGQFHIWEKRRMELVHSLGHYLLMLTEAELIQCFESWESKLKELQNVDKGFNYLLALLYISILHYFTRSADQIRTHISFMRKLLETKNKTQIMCAAQTFAWCASESQECVDFMRELLSRASKWITSQHTAFSALHVLFKSGNFLLPNVFEETSNNYKQLCTWLSCDDIDLQTMSAKVLQLHFKALKNNIAPVNSLFDECLNKISSQCQNLYGSIRVIDYILQTYVNPNQAMAVMDLVEKFPYLKYENLSFSWYVTLLKVVENKSLLIVITPDTAPRLLSTLFAACKKFMSLRLYEKVFEFFKSFNPSTIKSFLPFIIDFLASTVTEHRYPQICAIAFDSLSYLIDTFENSIRIPASFFLNAEPSPQYVSALRKSMRIFTELKPTIVSKFKEGISPKATIDHQILSLTIFSKFTSHIFDNIENVFDTISYLVKSPSKNVRLLMVTILPIFHNKKALDDLLFLALFDPEKSVRAAAVSQLKASHLEQLQLLSQILTDPSYTVRRNAIKLVAQVAPSNPMLFYVPITMLVQQTMISILTTSNPSICQKISSLLPLISQHLLNFCPSYIPQVIKVCYTFLCPEKYKNKDSKILSVIQRDMNHDGNLLISNTRPFDASCVNLNRVFEIENKHFIDKRDGDLFETLKCLAQHLGPYLDELMPIYLSVFSENRTELVYRSALNSLIEIVNQLDIASNIPTTQPTLPHTLITLLREKPSEEVAILILKLLATFGITSYPRNKSVYDDSDDIEFDFKSPSYYTDSVLNSLVKILDEEHSCVYESVTSIFVYEHHQAVKFLRPIIKGYEKAILTSKPKIRVVLFNHLEIICYYSGIRVASYAKTLTDLILQNISMPEALKVASVLSYFLKSEFIPFVPSLYQECCHILGMSKNGVSKELFRFLTYAVIFQNQPLDNFIFACEQRMLIKPSPDEITLMLNSLTTITHLSDVTFDCSRIARLCIPLLGTSNRNNVMQLLYSLVIFCHLNVEFLEFLLPDKDVGLPALKDYLSGKSLSIDSFITPMIIVCQVDPPSFLPPPYNSSTGIFESFTTSVPTNTEKWLEDLCKAVICGSPYACIRACLQPAITSPDFRNDIFPVAFLSCWKDAPKDVKSDFSKVMEQIYTDTTNPPEQIFLTLAELLLRAGVPFDISNYTLATACVSPMQSCRFLARFYYDNPNDTKGIEFLLDLNTRLSRHHNSRGLLKLKGVDLPNIAKWNEKLNQWEKALEIYTREESTNLPAILCCYARLERWDDIRKLNDQFQYLSPEQKSETALWYAWASLKCNDFNDVSSFMTYMNSDDSNLETILFKLIFYVKSDNTEAAQKLLKYAMQLLVNNCSIYSSLNAARADTNLIYANHFIELEEALNFRKQNITKPPKIWARRLSYITGDSQSFMRLVEIRNLVASPTTNRRTYLKLLSILVKERKWNLVDRFQPLVLEHIDSPDVQVSFVKILWHRGKANEAIEAIHLLNAIHSITEKSTFIEAFNNVNKSSLESLAKVISTKDFKVESTADSFYEYAVKSRKFNLFDDKQKARMLRLEATWIGQEYSTVDNALEMFQKSANLYANDYRTWSNWAYTASKNVDDSDKDDKYVQMAINGFLRASILHTSNTLEYLCQLFSLLFRYSKKMTFQEDIFTCIKELLPPVIEQILPQIVCHISHSEEVVRNLVHQLIISIAAHHFQSVVYQIQLIANDVESEKSQIARDILSKISLPHPELASEASMLSDGLSRSAVTYYDIWYSRIDEAYHLELSGDRERSMQKLKTMTTMRQNKRCKLDETQLKSVDTQFNTVINAINKNPKKEFEVNQMWSPVRLFFQTIREKINKMDVIQLETVCQELSEKRDFKLSIPGTYTTTNKGPSIISIDSTLPVLNTQQHPRILYMYGSDGAKWKFLLKGNEDLRLDQRIMQFFDLINSLVKSNKVTQKTGITIINYSITPLAVNAGLISWVTGADTMHQLVTDYRKMQNIPVNAENDITASYVGSCAQYLHSIQKLEMWDKISKECPATELRDYFWMKSPNPVAWLRCVDTFSLSTALMSMSGYVVGLGDRHPSNIMIQRKKGHVVHIDFGDSFEVTQTRPKMPEKVPFRLTRMIVNALGVSQTAGQFATMCENVLYILRKNKSSIFAQLEIFVHEPIFASRDSQNNGTAIMNRVSMKLNGLDPSIESGSDVSEELSVEEQTSRLISIASDYHRYVTHYDGWCPYW